MESTLSQVVRDRRSLELRQSRFTRRKFYILSYYENTINAEAFGAEHWFLLLRLIVLLRVEPGNLGNNSLVYCETF